MRLELAMARAGITYRQFDHWNRIGLLPWGNPGSGNRRPRDIRDHEAQLLITMGRLVSDGVTPKRANEAAMELVDAGKTRLGGFTLIAERGAAA
jgi:DNA-binding transcriptional MerR regulator